MDSIGSQDARREWRRLLDEVMRGGMVTITRHGLPVAVLVPQAWYDAAAREVPGE